VLKKIKKRVEAAHHATLSTRAIFTKSVKQSQIGPAGKSFRRVGEMFDEPGFARWLSKGPFDGSVRTRLRKRRRNRSRGCCGVKAPTSSPAAAHKKNVIAEFVDAAVQAAMV